jgi:hypothetical protein
MHGNLKKVVIKWRDAGNALLAKDPDDRAGDGLIKCANDLEAALHSTKPWSTVGVILAAGSLLFGETFLEHQHGQETTTYTLAAPRPALPEIPPVQTDDTERESGDRNVVSTFSVVSTSGANVVAHLETISLPGGPQWRVKLPKSG